MKGDGGGGRKYNEENPSHGYTPVVLFTSRLSLSVWGGGGGGGGRGVPLPSLFPPRPLPFEMCGSEMVLQVLQKGRDSI